MDEKKLTDEELKQAFFILRHGSSEGLSEYIKAVLAIENEYNRRKAEINRLTEENKTFLNRSTMWKHLHTEVCEENAELQKQVDELKELNAKYLDSIESLTAGKCVLRCELTKQAVKDTAKEILQMLYDDRNGYWDSCDCGKDETFWRDNSIQGTLNEIKERYGVEVE